MVIFNEDLSNNKLPDYTESYWIASSSFPSFNEVSGDFSADIVIVGAGITGITTAYLLSREGLKVTVLDAGKILNGTTGHTTAKVTVQHNLIYDELISNLGKEKAQLYYNANNEALKFIYNTISENNISCDFKKEDAYIFTNSEEYEEKLIKEFKAYGELGINGEYLDSIPIPVPIRAALKIKDQAQFHPLKYLHFMVEFLIKNQSTLYENTEIIDIEPGENTVLTTSKGHEIQAKQVVIASHFPFCDEKGLYFARMYAERSYVLGIKPEKKFPGGMYISAEGPGRSIRSTPFGEGELLLIGGENHKTGQGPDTMSHYEALKQFADETFGVSSMEYRWSAQDLTTLDMVPYIGHLTSDFENIYVATGYRKWGMTNATAAALILRDMIIGVENPYTELFTPSRFNADPSIKNAVTQNANVAKNLIKGKLEVPSEDYNALNPDEGKVVSYKGNRAGAYKDKEGNLHIVDTTCTHMGCELQWNSGDRSWDCPCHGSRFSFQGKVIEGPALQPLKKLK